MTCPLTGCKNIEDDNHLAKCEVINAKRSVIKRDLDYFDLFSNNVEKQFSVTCYLDEGEKIRDELLETETQDELN